MQNVEDAYGLTPIQQGMLSHHLRNPESDAYRIVVRARLGGPVDRVRLQDAWNEVVARHSALRTFFVWDRLDEPLQVVRKEVPVTIETDGLVEQAAAAVKFDLTRPPLFRITLTKTSETGWLMTWVCHHLIMDGWSMLMLLREVVDCYNEGRQAAAAPPRFREFVDWLNKQNDAAATSFWRSRLQDVSEPFLLQRNLPVPGNGAGYDRIEQPLRVDGIQEACRERRVTLSTLLHGAWAILLSRYSDSDQVVFGTTSSGRPVSIERVEEIAGLFISTQPVRVRVDPEEKVDSFLSMLQLELAAIREHEHMALSRVQKLSGIGPSGSLFDTLLVVENFPPEREKETVRGVTLTDLEVTEHSEYPLAAIVSGGDRLDLHLVYDAAQFDKGVVERIGRHFEVILRGLVDGTGAGVGDIPMLTREERTNILVGWSRTSSRPLPEKTVVDLVRESARHSPENPAVIDGGHTITYRQLWSASGKLAKSLAKSGIGRGDRVGIQMERSAHHPIAMLGVLRAGAAFVMLDPSYPAGRLELMASEADLSRIISASDVSDLKAAALLDESIAADVPITGDDLAYIMFTSGSTGVPKGVMITHANLLNSTLARFKYYGEPVGRFLLLSPTAFDSSLVGFFWTLATGGTIVIPPPRAEQDVIRLSSLIQEKGITHTLLIPTLYRLILEEAEPETLAGLRVVIVAGEACDPGLVTSHYALLPDGVLYNEYGPTEACVWCTVHRTMASEFSDRDSVPIGRPIQNTTCYILDRRLRPVPVGVAGELYVGGANVSSGYFRSPDLTAERFIPNPFDDSEAARLYRTGDLARYREDGNIEFLGRVDSQLKVRGYRVETTDVESTLLRHPRVREAAVLPVSRSLPGSVPGSLPGSSPSVGRLIEALAGLPSAEREEALSRIENSQP